MYLLVTYITPFNDEYLSINNVITTQPYFMLTLQREYAVHIDSDSQKIYASILNTGSILKCRKAFTVTNTYMPFYRSIHFCTIGNYYTLFSSFGLKGAIGRVFNFALERPYFCLICVVQGYMFLRSEKIKGEQQNCTSKSKFFIYFIILPKDLFIFSKNY